MAIVPVFFLAMTCFAQAPAKKVIVNGHDQSLYTYDEAVKALTAHLDEFGVKGDLAPLPSIGVQLRTARTKKNVSIAMLAHETGLSEETIQKIERDIVSPTRDLLMQIEDYLGEELILANGK